MTWGNMDISKTKFVEVVGFGAVIVSLLFVAYEIRQANQIAVGTTTIEIYRNWMTINELIYTDEKLAALIYKLRDDTAELSNIERIQADAYARRHANGWVALEIAYENDLVTETLYQAGIKEVQIIISTSPGIRESLKRFATQHDLSQYEILAPLNDL
jgi:hypothetical protein